MYEWKELEKDGHPKDDCCCLVTFNSTTRIEMAIYSKCFKEFHLNNPESRYALIPLKVSHYMIYNPPE